MSKPHDDHSTPIKTPKQLIAIVIASFVVPVLLIVLLVNWVTGAKVPASAGTDAYSEKAIAARIAPVARLDFKDPNAVKVLKTGEQVYQAACTACHAVGAAGAPKSGDAAAWAPRIKLGLDTLVKSVINGKGAMPARAGNPDLDDVEIARAVVYMANNAGAKFAEPAAPAAPVAAAAPAAAPAAANAAPAVAPAAPAAPAPAAPAAAAPAVAVAVAAAATAPAADAGKKVYDSVCMACHAAAVAGAPKFGDKAAWAARGNNLEALTATVIKGKGAMPPKGGSAASEAEIKAAVAYMLAAVK